MLNNKSKLCIAIGMSCLFITQSMAYSLNGIKTVNEQNVNHQRVLVSSAIHYNTNGNMSMDNKGAIFSYNAANELTQVSLAAGAKESNYYYANGLRAVVQSNTQILVHYYSRNNELLNSSDGTQQSSAYLITNNVTVRSIMGDAIVLLHNRHGSVIGQLSDKPQFYQYGVYGVQKTEDGRQKTENKNGSLDLATNPLQYSGYMFDPLTGLYYLKARDYDPSLRSFIQVDSYAFNSYGLINGYFYGDNNPLMGIDLSGHFFAEFGMYPALARIEFMSLLQDTTSVLARHSEDNYQQESGLMKIKKASNQLELTKNSSPEDISKVMQLLPEEANIKSMKIERKKFLKIIDRTTPKYDPNNPLKLGHERFIIEDNDGNIYRLEYESKANILVKIFGRLPFFREPLGEIHLQINMKLKGKYDVVKTLNKEEISQVIQNMVNLQNNNNIKLLPNYKLTGGEGGDNRWNCQIFCRRMLKKDNCI
ncbi:RHS repeat domain-containing protein [Cysteiniphilum halobium]|uniref:RHS repeat domain-containing protein n=1 Tax=Cysteiniphilum halobium TaxID=2219059 RepID=UPI000E65B89F|nr:RHS repeat-associated core domain-containing protein [Cysteiniphilum halobium]